MLAFVDYFLEISVWVRIKKYKNLSRSILPSAVRITVVGGADNGYWCRHAWLSTRMTEQDVLYDLLQSPASVLQNEKINITLMNLFKHAVDMFEA